MIYAPEPLFLHERFRTRGLKDPDRAFALATYLHAIALAVSVITKRGAVIASQ
jgi:hypothetical protein